MDESLQNELRSFLADEQRLADALLSSGYQGSVFLYETGGTKFVIKQAAGGMFGWFHRLMLRREARVYERLADVDGVPHSPGFLNDRWLLLDYVQGESLRRVRKTLREPDDFYRALRKIIADCHAAGVAHGDLKRKDNVLVAADERPHVIDFGTAVMRDGGLLDRLLFPLIRRFDRNAWIKAKYRFDLERISAEDSNWYRPTVLEQTFRLLQKFWRVISFRQARKRRARRKADS
jgi:predicted Ser/Thr protein kinase